MRDTDLVPEHVLVLLARRATCRSGKARTSVRRKAVLPEVGIGESGLVDEAAGTLDATIS